MKGLIRWNYCCSEGTDVIADYFCTKGGGVVLISIVITQITSDHIPCPRDGEKEVPGEVERRGRGGQRDLTVGRTFALQAADLGSIPGTPFDSPGTVRCNS